MPDQEKIQVFTDFLGWGSTEQAKIVFLGYEPGAPVNTDSEPVTLEKMDRIFQAYMSDLKNGLLERDNWYKEWDRTAEEFESVFKKFVESTSSRNRPTEMWQIKFSLRALKRIFSLDVNDSWETKNLKRYNIDEFCSKNEICVNLYPIGKNGKSSPYSKEMKEFLGFPSKARKSDIRKAILAAGRYHRLQRFFAEELTGDYVTICMGGFDNQEEKVLKEEVFFKYAFPPDNWINPSLRDVRPLSMSAGGEVVFLPHPAGRRGLWSRKLVESVISEIKNRREKRA